MKTLMKIYNYMVWGLALTSVQCTEIDNRPAFQVTAFMPNDTGRADTFQNQVISDTIPKPSLNQDLNPQEVFSCGFEQPPQFPGGYKALYQFIKDNLRIPMEFRKSGIYDRVFVSFVVEKTGEIKDVFVLKGLGFGCDQEAVRLIESMPRWKPGTMKGEPVKVKYNLPISFVLKQNGMN